MVKGSRNRENQLLRQEAHFYTLEENQHKNVTKHLNLILNQPKEINYRAEKGKENPCSLIPPFILYAHMQTHKFAIRLIYHRSTYLRTICDAQKHHSRVADCSLFSHLPQIELGPSASRRALLQRQLFPYMPWKRHFLSTCQYIHSATPFPIHFFLAYPYLFSFNIILHHLPLILPPEISLVPQLCSASLPSTVGCFSNCFEEVCTFQIHENITLSELCKIYFGGKVYTGPDSKPVPAMALFLSEMDKLPI